MTQLTDKREFENRVQKDFGDASFGLIWSKVDAALSPWSSESPTLR